jgi:hypothetical protein
LNPDFTDFSPGDAGGAGKTFFFFAPRDAENAGKNFYSFFSPGDAGGAGKNWFEFLRLSAALGVDPLILARRR